MTGIERLDKIAELLNKNSLFRTWEDCERIVDLQKCIKVSDFFLWLMARESRDYCTETTFNKYMGTDAANCTCSWNTKLAAAVDGGYVKTWTVKNHGRYVKWVSLTQKGKKLLHV